MNEVLENDLFEAFSAASSHVYIYVCDMKNNLSRWSKNAVDYFEMPGEYMEDASSIWVQKIHPSDRQKYLDDISNVFSGKSARHHCEYRVLNKYGDYVWVECRGSMICDERGNATVFAGMMTRLDARNKYDPLTNLRTIYEFNNYDFSQGRGVVLLVGMDRFREVINNYGYSFGDMVLTQFCRRMQEVCKEDMSVYRLEGDEFVVIHPFGDRESAQRLFYELRRQAFDLGSKELQMVNLSISGGAVFYPEQGLKREVLLSNLEHSMEHAKGHRRGELVFFSQSIATKHNRTIRIKNALTESIREGFQGFELYFQPMVDTKERKVICCEALLRWHSDEIRDVGAAEAVKLLEASGEINVVGRWVAEQVFKKARKWQQEYEGFTVGFNASYVQFKDDSFSGWLIQKAEEYGADPSLISIELTESSKVENFENLAKHFQKLRDFGFKISLDDFGIAYSTLLLIRNLPADSVKIDHSFTLNLTKDNVVDLAIVESVVSLCRKLKIDVVAEGIETKEILEIMNQYPVSLLQGYYFAKPVPEQSFEDMIFKIYGQ